jgi:mannose-6-phosphate isomerase-like protein (cupin superfamily)
MKTLTHYVSALLVGAALLGTPRPLSSADEALEPAKMIWSPEQIQWQRLDADGTKYAVLRGDRDQPGKPFTYAFWMPGGVWVKAHTHTQDAHVAVVRGSIELGFGAKLDKSKAIPIAAGGFFVVPAGVPHFEGSQGECLIIGTALGGWKTANLE